MQADPPPCPPAPRGCLTRSSSCATPHAHCCRRCAAQAASRPGKEARGQGPGEGGVGEGERSAVEHEEHTRAMQLGARWQLRRPPERDGNRARCARPALDTCAACQLINSIQRAAVYGTTTCPQDAQKSSSVAGRPRCRCCHPAQPAQPSQPATQPTSSTKMTEGAILCARLNSALTYFSASPNHLLVTEDRLTYRKLAPGGWGLVVGGWRLEGRWSQGLGWGSL